jgi:hypothetical protein
VSDKLLGLDLVLPKECLPDEKFDLLPWYRHASRALSSDAEAWNTEVDVPFNEVIETARSEFGFSTLDMPSLKTVSDSPRGTEYSDEEDLLEEAIEEELSLDGALGIVCTGFKQTEFATDRLMLWERAIALDKQKARERSLPRAHRVGDGYILGQSVADILKFLQPYPGDELVQWEDSRRDMRRFKVERIRNGSYSIQDTVVVDEVILPMEYLRMPEFQLGQWFACERALHLGIINHSRVSSPSVEIDDLLAPGVVWSSISARYHSSCLHSVILLPLGKCRVSTTLLRNWFTPLVYPLGTRN